MLDSGPLTRTISIHPNIIKYTQRPQLKPGDLNPDGSWVSIDIAHLRADQMNEMLIREANMRVKPEDSVICVGDFACRGGEKGFMGPKTHPLEILKRLTGNWSLIAGNHDEQNDVKSIGHFMACDVGVYKVGVQHRPLFDVEAYLKWRSGTEAEKAANPWRDRISERHLNIAKEHNRYCCGMFDFIICGHVHNAWKTKKIAGIWHVNVGVDVWKYRPVNDTEVTLAFERARDGK